MMRYYYALILLIFSCGTSYSQTTVCTFPSIKSQDISLNEFNKLEVLELNTKTLRVVKYIVYIVYGDEHKNITDSMKTKATVVTVNGNSLKDPEMLKALDKFAVPFYVGFDEIKVIDSEKNQRTLIPRTFRIL